MALLMPEGLTNDQKLRLLDNFIMSRLKGLTNNQKAWLDNFIKSEKGQEKDGKKWAIEAAERMIRKMEKAQSEFDGSGIPGSGKTNDLLELLEMQTNPDRPHHKPD